jgi:hypothetical protein
MMLVVETVPVPWIAACSPIDANGQMDLISNGPDRQ